jgi:hypothetical protein
MQDLIDQIVEKTGVTAQQAKDSANIAVEWVKDELPEDIRGTVGGILDRTGDIAADAVTKSKNAAGSAAGVAGDAASSATESAESMWDKAKDAVSDLMPRHDE